MAKKAAGGKAPSLETLLRRLNPNVPAGQTDEAIPRAPRDTPAMRQIRAHLRADPFAKMLLTGHIGVGKSTELLHFAREMESERWVIRCSVAQTLGAHNVNAFSLLVVLLEAATRSWVERLGEILPGLVEELVTHVRKALLEGLSDSLCGVLAPAALAPDHFGGSRNQLRKSLRKGPFVVRMYGEILQRLAFRAVGFDQVMGLDPSPIVSSCDAFLKELSSQVQKPILLIIDDLDKVRDELGRDDVFLNRAMAWLRLPCGIVSTLPLDALFSPRGRELDGVWNGVQVLDPLPVPAAKQRLGLTGRALQPYLEILRSVGAQNAISELQCRRLANASSGVARTFVSACATAIAYVSETEYTHVRDHHVDLVLQDIADRWRGRLNEDDYQALIDVLDTEGSNVPRAITLLRDGILVRDGTAPPERQFRLAAWAEPLVEAYRRRVGRKQPTSS